MKIRVLNYNFVNFRHIEEFYPYVNTIMNDPNIIIMFLDKVDSKTLLNVSFYDYSIQNIHVIYN